MGALQPIVTTDSVNSGAIDAPAKEISKRHRLFCEFYLEYMDDEKAAEMAGYGKWYKPSQLQYVGRDIRTRPEVKAYLESRMPVAIKGIVLKQYVALAQYDVRKTYLPDGSKRKNPADLDDDTAMAVSAGGKTAKLEALRTLAQHIKFFPDKNNDSNTMNNFFASGSAPQFAVNFVKPEIKK